VSGSDHPGLGTAVSPWVRLSLTNATTLCHRSGRRHGEHQGGRQRARSSRLHSSKSAAAAGAGLAAISIFPLLALVGSAAS
jgi:hypothetical protein